MKLLLKLIGGLVVLAVILVVVVVLLINPLAKGAVEAGGTYALDAETTVESMDISLRNGTLQMNELKVANPEGFKSEHLIKTGQFDLAVDVGTLLSDTIEVSKFELNGLDMNIEQGADGSNISKILDSLKKFESKDEKPAEEPEGAGGKKVKVDEIVIRDIKAHFHLKLFNEPKTVTVPEITLENVSSEEGVPVSELISQILPAILAAVLEQAGGIPAEFVNGLKGEVNSLAAGLGGNVSDLVGQAREDVAENLKQAGDEIRKGLGGGVDEIKKGLGGLLEGNNDE